MKVVINIQDSFWKPLLGQTVVYSQYSRSWPWTQSFVGSTGGPTVLGQSLLHGAHGTLSCDDMFQHVMACDGMSQHSSSPCWSMPK